MARSTDEIQADIAVTRQLIERQLEALSRRFLRRWWVPYAAFVGAVSVGIVLSRVPLGTLVTAGLRTVQTGLAIVSTAAAVDRFVATRRADLPTAGRVERVEAPRRAA